MTLSDDEIEQRWSRTRHLRYRFTIGEKLGGRKEGKNGEIEGWGEKKRCSNDDVGHRGSVERVSEENGRARRRKTGGGEGEKPFATAWPLKSIGGREDWRGSGEKVRKGRERSNPWCGPLGKRGEG